MAPEVLEAKGDELYEVVKDAADHLTHSGKYCFASWEDLRASKRKRKQEAREAKKERKIDMAHVSKHRREDYYREDDI